MGMGTVLLLLKQMGTVLLLKQIGVAMVVLKQMGTVLLLKQMGVAMVVLKQMGVVVLLKQTGTVFLGRAVLSAPPFITARHANEAQRIAQDSPFCPGFGHVH